MYDSLREFLSELDEKGELQHVDVEVDPAWEITAATRKVFSWPPEKRPALIFENVKGSDMPLVVGVFGNLRRYAMILGCRVEEMTRELNRRLKEPIEPVMVSSGPCQENVVTGDAMDLFKLPVPVWTPEEDAGLFFTAPCDITKDPDTGTRNVGMYRLMLKGKRKLGINIEKGKHARIHYSKYEEKDKPMDVAIAIGPEPTVYPPAVVRLPYGQDELAFAGSLKGEPIELVKCKTVDLEVPATSEIVIEGEIPPHIREPEGPFGEYYGYMGQEMMNPIVNVKAITFRNKPIYQAFISQKMPNEGSMVHKPIIEAAIYRDLINAGISGVKAVDVSEAAALNQAVVSIKKLYQSDPRQVMCAMWGSAGSRMKQIIVVDEDIDVHNPWDVEWAVVTRVQPHRDVVIIPGLLTDVLDVSLFPEERMTALSSKLGIDATKKYPYPAIALPKRKYMEKVENQWNKYNVKMIEGKP